MLVQFRVKNYRSILVEQTLEMSASAGYKELVDLNTFETGVGEGLPRLLRSAVIYGPNASGKSNLVKAFAFMRDRVINSAKESQANEEIDVDPFRLTPASRSGASEFEVVFIEDEVRYQYGFRCDRSKVLEEWLYAFPLGRSQKWFHRVFNKRGGEDEFYFGPNFLGGRKRQDWREQTRANSLFLSTALQLNNEQLRPVLKWFQSRLVIIQGSNYSGVLGYTMSLCKDETQKNRVLEFINSADISISDIRLEDRLFSDDMLPKDFPMRDRFVELLDGKKGLRAMFMHDDVETGEAVPFDLEDESDGTRALFAFSGPWLDVVDNGRVLVVDELDSSLHPLMVRHLVNLLHHEGGKAQLVFTTHDTSLLSQKIFRRDQIWFMEKNRMNATELYPLADFGPRDNEAVERKYLNGRYGGIPFLKEMDFHGVG
ncbi:MAG: ATP-binding protein [Gammaproteobacteria bacterium]|nr:ATP-binding protein [Gammaproteobacteria bacterium]